MTSKFWSQNTCVLAGNHQFTSLILGKDFLFPDSKLSYVEMKQKWTREVPCIRLAVGRQLPDSLSWSLLALWLFTTTFKGTIAKTLTDFYWGEKISSVVRVYRWFQTVRMVVFPEINHSFTQMKPLWKIGGISELPERMREANAEQSP